jgi:hypothetical protein
MEINEFELAEIKKEYPYIEYIWKWTKKFNPFEYEMWGNKKIGNFILLTALQQNGLMTTKLYKIDTSTNKIIKDYVISEFDTNEKEVDFDTEENLFDNFNKISIYYKVKYNIEWVKDNKTKYFQLIQVDNILRFIYPKNKKIRTTDFYLDEATGIILNDEMISEIDI